MCFGGCTQEQAENNFIKQQDRDQYLQKLCDENGVQLIWIDGRTYTNSKLKNYIIKNIIPIIKSAQHKTKKRSNKTKKKK